MAYFVQKNVKIPKNQPKSASFLNDPLLITHLKSDEKILFV